MKKKTYETHELLARLLGNICKLWFKVFQNGRTDVLSAAAKTDTYLLKPLYVSLPVSVNLPVFTLRVLSNTEYNKRT